MGELSASMELANSTMTRMVDQLVRKGLVQREPDLALSRQEGETGVAGKVRRLCQVDRPPSIMKTPPVQKLLSSLARNSISCATSSGVP